MRKEVAHAGLVRLEVVGSMHERKQLMAELADGFVGSARRAQPRTAAGRRLEAR